jgi:hypothetical protein
MAITDTSRPKLPPVSGPLAETEWSTKVWVGVDVDPYSLL